MNPCNAISVSSRSPARRLAWTAFVATTLLCGIPTEAAAFDGWHKRTASPTADDLVSMRPASAWRLDASGGESSNLIESLISLQDSYSVIDAASSEQRTLRTSNRRWVWSNPTAAAENYGDAFFLNGQEGWVTIFDRGLMHTRDGGVTWEKVSFGPPMGFYDVFFADQKHGWAVGNGSNEMDFTHAGLIWATTDGGKTWHPQYNDPDQGGLGTVRFINAQVGWAAGRYGTVLKTVDGGKHWSPLPIPDEAKDFDFTDSVWLDLNRGWLLGDKNGRTSLVLLTVDGGQSWQTSPIDDYDGMFHITFADSQNGWVGGWTNNIWWTDDGGVTWTPSQLPGVSKATKVKGLSLTGDGEGFVVLESGEVFFTNLGIGTDTDISWNLVTTIPLVNVTGMKFVDSEHGWIFGDLGLCYRTTDSGRTWQSQRRGSMAPLYDITFSEPTVGWAVGEFGTIQRTDNVGRNWVSQQAPISSGLYGISFANARVGWIVGEYGRILKTTDAGQSWLQQAAPVSADLDSIAAPDRQHAWAVGDGATLLHTTSGGKSWQIVELETAADLSKVKFRDHKHGWFLGNDYPDMLQGPWLYRTEDGGATWQQVSLRGIFPSSAHQAKLADFCFIDPLTGWAVGGWSGGEGATVSILHTQDGGKTWQTQSIETSHVLDMSTILFTDARHGFVMGQHGSYATTSDGGDTWVNQVRPNAGGPAHSSTIAGRNTSFVVGDGGMILKSTNWFK